MVNQLRIQQKSSPKLVVLRLVKGSSSPSPSSKFQDGLPLEEGFVVR